MCFQTCPYGINFDLYINNFLKSIFFQRKTYALIYLIQEYREVHQILRHPNYAEKHIVSCDFYEYINQEFLKLLFNV